MRRNFKYRIYPTPGQERELNNHLVLCCELYNAALEERRTAWEEYQVNVSWVEQQNQLPHLKKEREEFSLIHSGTLQDVIRKLDRSFQNFFRRCRRGEKPGFPRFKSHRRYNSITFPKYPWGAKLVDGRLRLQNIGYVKINLQRPIEGLVKTATVKRKNEKWYVVFSCVDVPTKPLPKTGESVGVDAGLESLAVLSNGDVIENPRWKAQMERKLIKQQRIVSRRKKGSNRRRKAVLQLAKIHEKIDNKRKEDHWLIAKDLVRRFDTIYIEDLNVKGMTKHPRLAKSIHDASWGLFFQRLMSKAEEAEKEVVKVDPRGTSQRCSGCDEVVEKKLWQRQHDCPSCGLSLSRDHNAAINIKRLGESLRGAVMS